MIATMVRSADPVESHMAAAAVSENVKRDRYLILTAFTYCGFQTTYRQAAEKAQELEGGTEIARLESLRRRGSDLKKLGWISQDGRFDGQATFNVTLAGLLALREALNAQ